jgi:NAD(P)-dependent dehydrogenase (short-subunit alcohol dehydrogenase family)
VLFTYELARRLRGTRVTATVLHPGVVRSGFGVEDPGRIQRVITPFMGLLKSPEQGAQTSIHLASAPEVEGVTGQFFANRRPRKSSRRSYDEADARRLWEVSAELVHLDPASLRGR